MVSVVRPFLFVGWFWSLRQMEDGGGGEQDLGRCVGRGGALVPSPDNKYPEMFDLFLPLVTQRSGYQMVWKGSRSQILLKLKYRTVEPGKGRSCRIMQKYETSKFSQEKDHVGAVAGVSLPFVDVDGDGGIVGVRISV